jgi:hypothetical protein
LLFFKHKIDNLNSNSKHTIVYPNIPSALRPVELEVTLKVRKPAQQRTLHEEDPTSTSPEDELGLACYSVDPDFPELTQPQQSDQSPDHGNILTDFTYYTHGVSEHIFYQ